MQPIKPLSIFQGYGIELEYMIVDRETLSVAPLTDRVLKEIAGVYLNEVEVGELRWSNELVLHVIELKTNGAAKNLARLPGLFHDHIKRINTILQPLNAKLMPTSMHPWMHPDRETKLWPHENNEIYDQYNRIFDCRGHGWANLQSMHINLPFNGAEEFGRLHAAVRLVLPILPALAASSPVYEDKPGPFLDNRLNFYMNNQRKIPELTGKVIPEPVFTPQEYQDHLLQTLYNAIAPYDPEGILQEEWLNSRGAIARFERNTIEIRILDIQESPQMDIAIASLIIALLKALTAEYWSSLKSQKQMGTEPLYGIFLETVKDGDRAIISDARFLKLFNFPEKGAVRTSDLWQYLLESLEKYDSSLSVFGPALKTLLSRGCLSRRILKALNGDFSRNNLMKTYRRLTETLEENTMF
jgi:gamma-glutamyl:cysteine ligase YbdK (ATP-grasp superfamily)